MPIYLGPDISRNRGTSIRGQRGHAIHDHCTPPKSAPTAPRSAGPNCPAPTPPASTSTASGGSSAHCFAEVASSDGLRGRRSLLLDLLGYGISDRPVDADYTVEDHADWIATALRTAGVSGAQIIAHSMGGSIAIVLALRHPDLVASLILIDSNLDPAPEIPRPGSSQIARYGETVFLHGGGYEETLQKVQPGMARDDAPGRGGGAVPQRGQPGAVRGPRDPEDARRTAHLPVPVCRRTAEGR